MFTGGTIWVLTHGHMFVRAPHISHENITPHQKILTFHGCQKDDLQTVEKGEMAVDQYSCFRKTPSSREKTVPCQDLLINPQIPGPPLIAKPPEFHPPLSKAAAVFPPWSQPPGTRPRSAGSASAASRRPRSKLRIGAQNQTSSVRVSKSKAPLPKETPLGEPWLEVPCSMFHLGCSCHDALLTCLCLLFEDLLWERLLQTFQG